MSKGYDKLANRLVSILTKFNDGDTFTVDDLAEEFGVDKRTIQRDLNDRFQYLPIKKNGKYYSLESYALGKLSFKDIKNFATLSGIKELYPDLDDNLITDILNQKLNNPYLVRNQGFENINTKKDFFERISGAIVKNSPICFTYSQKQRFVNPYKLINNVGVWYLLADENGKLKTFTFSKIENFTWEDEEGVFTPKKEFLEKIKQNEQNWFSNDSFEVVLQIKNEAIPYFKRKDILPNYKIIEEDENHIQISTNIAYDDEILRVAKYWIPFIKIVSPKYLDEKFCNILRNYLS